jgi:hypothetical protein
MSKLTATIKREFLEMLPPTIFFFVILHIVAIVRALMIRGTGIELPASASVTIAALVLGKSVLLANMLPFVNRFPEKPLIWNTGWRTLIGPRDRSREVHGAVFWPRAHQADRPGNWLMRSHPRRVTPAQPRR